ncbi:hypothetical protein CQZ94_30275 [Bacillus sp. MYb209]|uniref:hypothetical protein n=1 Tax=Bacillus sp. MYb209 TaxID=1848605 RepID=UPI000CFB8D7C|nr:hypothetical protein [Bacillus sp. MYb209]PQZ42201.1 hypothetical protein CQZ94_30275 [Bacillus sp. MYb209]
MDTNKSTDSENGLQPLDIDMIDTEGASEGIKVTIEPYPAMEPGDRIEIFWDGRTHDYTIDEDEVNQSIEIEIPFTDAKKIQNKSVPLYYRITDRAGNISGPPTDTE